MACLPLLSACSPAPYSSLHPATEQAGHIAMVWQLMAWGSLAILMVMLVLVWLAVRSRSTQLPATWLLLGGGVAFPLSVISALLLYTYVAAPEVAEPQYRVQVTARQWYWEVQYPDSADGTKLSVNVIHVPRGVPTLIELRATDVIHGFWVPRLGGKMDAIPGRVNRLVYTPAHAGVYHGQCAEYCGAGHATMRFELIAHENDALVKALAALPTTQEASP